MKCLACDKILSDREASRVYVSDGTHVDLCGECFDPISGGVETKSNFLLEDQQFEGTIYTPVKKKKNESQPDESEEER